MTKRELLAALEPYGDDEEVIVNLHSDYYPNGSQVAIQGVRSQAPWHGGLVDQSNWIVGLLAHVENAKVSPASGFQSEERSPNLIEAAG